MRDLNCFRWSANEASPHYDGQVFGNGEVLVDGEPVEKVTEFDTCLGFAIRLRTNENGSVFMHDEHDHASTEVLTGEVEYVPERPLTEQPVTA